MSRRQLALLCLCGSLLAACAPRAVDHEQVSRDRRIVASFSHVTAENSPKHLAATRFAETARLVTGGRVEVQVYPNSQLFKDGEEVEALQRGEIQFIAVTASKLASLDPRWQIFDMPYLFDDPDDVERLVASDALETLRTGLKDLGLVPLAMWPNGFKQFTNMRHPLVSPADFQGLTFRVQAGAVLHDQFQAVGATAVVSSFDTLYSEIEHQSVDGQENTLSNIYTLNLQELQPYLTLSNHGYLSYVVMTQAAWWNSLEPQVQRQLRDALAETTQWSRTNARVMNDQALRKMLESGKVEVRTLSQDQQAALQEAFAPAYRAVADRLGGNFMTQVLQTVNGR